MKFGCINEDEFSFHSPRIIEGDEADTLAGAFEQAIRMMEEGVDHVSICHCQYYGEDGNGYWGEIVGHGQISVDASYCYWVKDEEDEEIKYKKENNDA
jgi:hypothetical protein